MILIRFYFSKILLTIFQIEYKILLLEFISKSKNDIIKYFYNKIKTF